MKIVKFKEKEIHNFCEPYIIAEIGANHNGDMDLAREMIDSAKNNGADCVKFQSWTAKSLIAKEEYERNQTYNDSKKKHFGSLREMVTKYALTKSQHKELKDYCVQEGIDFASSPFSVEEAEMLVDLDVPFLKVASMDINYTSFLEKVAGLGKPMIISTGMSTIGEIERALNICYKAGNTDVVLLHCISIYPPKYEDIHLRNITTLQNTFGVPVGFSDHTIGTTIPLTSAALGACVIEKHFTTDKDLPGWDHEISANPKELRIISDGTKNVIKSLGSFVRTVSQAEEEKKSKFRRSLVLNRSLDKGHIITAGDLTAKRPGTAIPPDLIHQVIGKKLNVDLKEDTVLKWDFLK